MNTLEIAYCFCFRYRQVLRISRYHPAKNPIGLFQRGLCRTLNLRADVPMESVAADVSFS